MVGGIRKVKGMATGVANGSASAGQKVLLWAIGLFLPIATVVISAVLGYYINRLDDHGKLDGHKVMIERVDGLRDDVKEIKVEQRSISAEQREHTRQLDRIETIVKQNGNGH